MNAIQKEYVVGLCAMTEHGLAPPYDSDKITATDDEQATRKAMAWARTNAGMIGENTWVQVLIDGKSIHSEELEPQFAQRP